MTLTSAATLALLLHAEEPSYPLGPLRFPTLTEPARPVLLTDVRYRVSDEARIVQALALRLRLGSWAFLGAEVDDQRRGLSLTTQRLDLSVSEEGGRYDVRGGYRAPRLLLRTDATRRGAGRGWVVGAEGAVRLTPDLELLVDLRADTDPARRLPTRPLRQASLGFLYQRGTRLDVSAQALRSRVRTEAGVDVDLERWSAGASVLLGAQWDLLVGYEKAEGRFRRREGFASADVAAPLSPHLLAQLHWSTAWEPGVNRFEEELRAGLTFFGRRLRLPRSGEAAARTVALVRRANSLGYNERRAHDVDGRRALRERLALSARREELREEIEALYRAQVAERDVEQAGLEFGSAFNTARGTRARSYGGFLAVPWPPAWPFRRNEDSVPFLKARYAHVEERFDFGLTSVTREASLEVALNREMSLVFRWRKPGSTPLDIAREVAPPRTLELEYVYAFGR